MAKMLADKIRFPSIMRKPGAGAGVGGGGGMMVRIGGTVGSIQAQPPVKPTVQENVDMAKLLEEVPFEEKTRKRKPSRKVFIEKKDDD